MLLLVTVSMTGCLNKNSTVTPSAREDCISSAQQLLKENDIEKAISLVENYVTINGADASLDEILARAYSLNNNKKLAGFYYEQSANLSDLKSFNYLKAAEEYLQVNELALAKVCYEKYLTEFPEDDYILIEYAKTLYSLKEYDKALPILIKNSENNCDLYSLIASIYEHNHDYINSQIWYQSILEFDNHNRDALYGKIRAAINLKDYDEFLQLEEIVIDKNIESIDEYSIPAIIDAIKSYYSAIEDFRNAKNNFINEEKFSKHELFKSIKPIFKSPNTSIDKKQEDGQNKKKLTSADRLYSLNAEIEDYKTSGNFLEASNLLWKVLGIDNNNTEAWINLADCSEQIQRYDIVEVALWEALKRTEYREDIYLKFLNAASENHNGIEYAKIVRDAKHKLPHSAKIRLIWAQVQDSVCHNHTKAQKAYKKFLQLADINTQYNEIVSVQKLLNE